MNVRHGLRFGFLSLAVVALFAPSASASIIGHLSVANCANGGVTVSFGLIDWSLGSPQACLNSGIGTNLSSDAGSLGVIPVTGTINDLPSVPGVTGFMTFGVLLFDLAPVGGFGPGLLNDCFPASPAVGSSCSIQPGSPFILTTTSTGTSVTLLAHGTIVDPLDGKTSLWNGAFTTQINGQSPLQIHDTIVGGGAISSSFSGEFDVIPLPEPVTMSLIGGGLIALAAMKKRRVV